MPESPPVEISPNDRIVVNHTAEVLAHLLPDSPAVDTLLLAAADQERWAESSRPASGSPNMYLLQHHKSNQRLLAAAGEITLTNPNLTIEEVLSQPSKYGLSPRDAEAVKATRTALLAMESSLEEKFHVLRLDRFRALVMNRYLNKGGRGALIALDLVGLKIFNTYGHTAGDAALNAVAKFCRDFLTQQGFDDAELLVGRKADEFYLFVPEGNPQDTAEKLHQMHQSVQARGDHLIPVQTEGNGSQKKPALFYWRAGAVDKANFDEMLEKLDFAVETAKINVMQRLLENISQGEVKSEQRLALILLELINKRIPIAVIEKLTLFGYETFCHMVEGQNIRLLESSQIIKYIKSLVENPEVVQFMAEVMTQAAISEETVENRIIN